jgi:sulfatase maturation enzyme AslB (radical SAM superfamily)
VDPTGRFFLLSGGDQKTDFTSFLRSHGFAPGSEDNLEQFSREARRLARDTQPSKLDYLILIPTLRCNLSCSYCQVSRAPENGAGFDWTEESVCQVEALLDGLDTTQIKIEFQGGEPTLRWTWLDASLIAAIALLKRVS